MLTDDEELTTAAAAKILGLTPGWMAAMRSKKTGPTYRKRGTKVYYLKSDLERYRDAINGEEHIEVYVLEKTTTKAEAFDIGKRVYFGADSYHLPADAKALLVVKSKKRPKALGK